MRAAQSFVVVDGVVDVVAFSFNFICFVIIILQKQFRHHQVKTFSKADIKITILLMCNIKLSDYIWPPQIKFTFSCLPNQHSIRRSLLYFRRC